MLTECYLFCGNCLVAIALAPTCEKFAEQVLRDNFVQQGAGNLRETTSEFRNYEATILHNSSPHKLHKVVRSDGYAHYAHLVDLL